MKNTVYAYELTGLTVIAHIKNENGCFEFDLDRQEFENSLPRINGMIDCSFTGVENGEVTQMINLYLTTEEYWTQGEGVNDAGIVDHISQYIATNEAVRLRLDKQIAMQALMSKLPDEALKALTAYNNATHEYHMHQLNRLSSQAA